MGRRYWSLAKKAAKIGMFIRRIKGKVKELRRMVEQDFSLRLIFLGFCLLLQSFLYAILYEIWLPPSVSSDDRLVSLFLAVGFYFVFVGSFIRLLRRNHRYWDFLTKGPGLLLMKFGGIALFIGVFLFITVSIAGEVARYVNIIIQPTLTIAGALIAAAFTIQYDYYFKRSSLSVKLRAILATKTEASIRTVVIDILVKNEGPVSIRDAAVAMSIMVSLNRQTGFREIIGLSDTVIASWNTIPPGVKVSTVFLEYDGRTITFYRNGSQIRLPLSVDMSLISLSVDYRIELTITGEGVRKHVLLRCDIRKEEMDKIFEEVLQRGGLIEGDELMNMLKCTQIS
jgi:energy-converting hydrogenase Eha subunit E